MFMQKDSEQCKYARRPTEPTRSQFFFFLPVGRSRALLRPLLVHGRSTLLTQRLSQRVKVADSDLASDMQTTLFASAGAERGGEWRQGEGGGSKKESHES